MKIVLIGGEFTPQHTQRIESKINGEVLWRKELEGIEPDSLVVFLREPMNDEKEKISDLDNVILPYWQDLGEMHNAENNHSQKLVTYSDTYNEADFVAKNIRQVDGDIKFEVISTASIGRVSIKDNGFLNICSSLALTAMFTILESSLQQAIETVNQI